MKIKIVNRKIANAKYYAKNKNKVQATNIKYYVENKDNKEYSEKERFYNGLFKDFKLSFPLMAEYFELHLPPVISERDKRMLIEAVPKVIDYYYSFEEGNLVKNI